MRYGIPELQDLSEEWALKRQINIFDKIKDYDAHITILRKGDTWSKVSKMTFACNPQLIKMDS